MRGIRLYAILAAMFMAGAFLASPELRVYAANTVGSADIINNSIQSVDIKDGEVKTVDLGNDAVTSAKIKNGEVKTDDIAPSAIGSLRIKDNDVKAEDLATDAVGSSEIATNAVGADEIAFDSVGGSEIKGVDKLIFADCDVPALGGVTYASGSSAFYYCTVAGIDPEDEVIVMGNTANCFTIASADISPPSYVVVGFLNTCNTSRSPPQLMSP